MSNLCKQPRNRVGTKKETFMCKYIPTITYLSPLTEDRIPQWTRCIQNQMTGGDKLRRFQELATLTFYVLAPKTNFFISNHLETSLVVAQRRPVAVPGKIAHVLVVHERHFELHQTLDDSIVK